MSSERLNPAGSMQNQSVMSLIRETEGDVQAWCANRSRQGPRDWAAEGMKDIIDQVITPENREWYYETMAKLDKRRQHDQQSLSCTATSSGTSGRSFTASRGHSRNPSIEEYLNKPLPPLPQQPYFEYMFADAGVEEKKSKDTVTAPVRVEEELPRKAFTSASTSSDSSLGLDSAELAQFAFAQAGVDILTSEADNRSEAHVSACDATVYGVQQPSYLPEGEPMQFEFTQTRDQPRYKGIIEPKSQKSKSKVSLRKCQPCNAASQRNITAPAVQPLSPNTVQKYNKRGARDSFLTKSTVNDNRDDYDVKLLSTKKVCVEEQRHSRNVRSMRASSVYSNITASSSSYSVNSIDGDLALPPQRKRLTNAPTGYPGQFPSYESKFLHCRASGISSPRLHLTCGDPLHPNNQFTHTNFVADPTWPSKNYTKEDLERFPMRNAALSHAYRLTVRAAKILTRTESEANLRREVQRECASARLEGVAVGQYRYYQGHMSMEEYKAARVCICWDSCWCSKLCTIYGDVLCPCTDWIVLNNH
ncbi:hypothetical protein A1O1_08997 [Capronia coronata CBS 617.96]|uniref:Uncharacterized protein n=1 Tax=Capronia coronata CBS 617.96 TaxID=1182541 RepID=W9XNQ6_9EURO|nr:uncharacterized protein A1O1_08997 [Capronia coronata CBS 617.96]EXJ78596.1 hypothetical protein A1O1_08997 [Capronia coronata CBS 617.96]